MTEELNNQDLFNLEDNEPFIGGEDFPNLPPLKFDKDDDNIDIDSIPEKPAPTGAVKTSSEETALKPKKERKPLFAFLKKEKGEKAPKEKKEKPAKLVEPTVPTEKKEKAASKPKEKRERVFVERDWQSLGPLFWTISGAIALLIAIILLVVVLVIGFNAVKVAQAINQDLVGSLHQSFVQMDQAHIRTTIPIEAEVPAQFDLLLDTITTVTLSEDTYISSANVSLSTGGLTISNAPTNITLPAGSQLPIHLVLTVPVDEMIPVVMDVEVDIPMSETELHEPFTNLQKTIQPYYLWLWSLTTKGVSPLALPWEQ
ncbi:MAG: hypothetical protein V2J07_09690 [Anaerolineae bacterium]|jgi:hypothetical protein|nr:hypothetical protein [Anaerolineae bacterium]